MTELYRLVEAALLQKDPQLKCDQVEILQSDWLLGRLDLVEQSKILPLDDPGRPQQPELVEPRNLAARSFATENGRISLLHSIAHIEFNAINIALDAVYRFRSMPCQYVSDWLLVASEEARHFRLLEQELRSRNSFYGAYQAHRGLWDMVCKTRDNPLHRMALVPRVMEARGLDVTPALIKKFEQVDDLSAVNLLKIIYRDEIGHVRIGNDWYRYLCKQQGLDPVSTFQALLQEYMGGRLRGPFNWPARLEAGFDEAELRLMEQSHT